MVKRLNLTRNQFASFLKDFEQIKQFELLFSEVNKLISQGSAEDDDTSAATAMATANEAMSAYERIKEALDFLALAPPDTDAIGSAGGDNVPGGISRPTSSVFITEEREDNHVKTDYLDLNRTAPVVSTPGRFWWDEGEKTAILALSGGNVELHLGQEEVQNCYNDTAGTLSKGTVVQITGAQGNRLKVAKAQANAEATSVHTLGFVDEPLAAGAEGFVINSGLLRNINTTVDSEGNALTPGQTLYLSTTVAGGYTSTKPSAPAHMVIVGFVVRVSATVGSIFVKVDNGYELDELHNVKITAPVNAGSLLIYDATTKVWKNATLTQGTGVTITNGDASITISAHVPVTLNASVTDVLSLSTQEIGAVDAGADKIVFWDDSAGKTTYLAPSAPIQITGTNLEHGTSGVAAATYGSTTQVPQIAVNAQGHITSASNVGIAFPAAANCFGIVAVSGQSNVVADAPGGTLTLVQGSNVTITTNATADSITINASQPSIPNNFGTIAVAGQSNVVADSTSDTLTLVAGSNVTITTNATADSVTINASQPTVPSAATTVVSETSFGQSAAVGTSTSYARADHTHGTPTETQITIGSSASDILSASNHTISAVDNGADGIVFWDDSAGKLRYLKPDAGTSIVDNSLFALGGIIAVTVYDSSTGGSWTSHSTNSATKSFFVEVVGGGGGGRSATAAANQVVAGAGGGAGGYSFWYGVRASGQNYEYLVGAGGGANTAGTDSAFRQALSTEHARAKGGGEGPAAMASNNTAATTTGGSGGSGGSGTKSYNGEGGGAAIRLSGTVGVSGAGGASILGGGGRAVVAGNPGVAGQAPGAGGSGGCSNSATPRDGGAGKDGMVRIWEFY